MAKKKTKKQIKSEKHNINIKKEREDEKSKGPSKQELRQEVALLHQKLDVALHESETKESEIAKVAAVAHKLLMKEPSIITALGMVPSAFANHSGATSNLSFAATFVGNVQVHDPDPDAVPDVAPSADQEQVRSSSALLRSVSASVSTLCLVSHRE